MGRRENRKRPRAEFAPTVEKEIRGTRAADAVPAMQFKWSTDRLDWGGPFSWNALTTERLLREIIPKLQDYESMTWGELEGTTGSHFVDVTDLVKTARKRLKEIGMHDTDQLFSLRLAGKIRIWGVRDIAVLQMLWWDPDHEVCPSEKKRT